jgi:hypothetical protein
LSQQEFAHEMEILYKLSHFLDMKKDVNELKKMIVLSFGKILPLTTCTGIRVILTSTI